MLVAQNICTCTTNIFTYSIGKMISTTTILINASATGIFSAVLGIHSTVFKCIYEYFDSDLVLDLL